MLFSAFQLMSSFFLEIVREKYVTNFFVFVFREKLVSQLKIRLWSKILIIYSTLEKYRLVLCLAVYNLAQNIVHTKTLNQK